MVREREWESGRGMGVRKGGKEVRKEEVFMFRTPSRRQKVSRSIMLSLIRQTVQIPFGVT